MRNLTWTTCSAVLLGVTMGTVEVSAQSYGFEPHQRGRAASHGLRNAQATPKAESQGSAHTQTILSRLRQHEGAAVVMPKGAWSDDSTSFDQHRLNLLLILASSPNLLNNRDTTARFLPLINPNDAQRYASGSRLDWSWLGNDEFQREAMRRLFIERERSGIEALIPRLPFDIVDVRPVTLNDYDFSSGSFGLQKSGDWTLQNMPLPFHWPERWKVPPEAAGRIMDQVRVARGNKQSFSRRLVLVSRLRVQGVRAGRTMEALIDTSVSKIEIYLSPDLKTKLGDVPIPEGALSSAKTTTIGHGAVEYDSELPILYALKLAEASTRPSELLRMGASARRNVEMGYGASSATPPIGAHRWPAHFPASLIASSQTTLTDDDIRRYVKWTEERLAVLPDRVRFSGVFGRKQNGQLTIDLESALNDRASAASDLRGAATAIARRRYPEALGASLIEFNRHYGVVAVHARHVAWSGVNVMTADRGMAGGRFPGITEFRVTSARLDALPTGLPLILLEIVPTVAGESNGGQLELTDLSIGTATISMATPQRLDILGVTVGEAAEAAEAKIRRHIDGREFAVTSGGSADGVFATGLWFRESRKAYPYYGEVIVLLFDNTSRGSVVGAVGRILPTWDMLASAVQKGLDEKFGPPIDYGSPNAKCGTRCDLIWTEDEPARRAIAARKLQPDTCGTKPIRAFSRDADQISMYEIKEPCGIVLSGFLNDKSASYMLLVNSNRVLELRRELLDRRKQQAPDGSGAKIKL